MTGSPLQTRSVPTPARPAPGVRAARPAPAMAARPPLLAVAAEDDELRLNLSDLPRRTPSLHVDGFTPSVTSRLLDLIDRLRGR